MIYLLIFYLDESPNSSRCSDGMKRIAPSIVTDVFLPTLDVYSDLSLIFGWLFGGHWKYAISMSIPVLLQFLFTIQKWIRLEKPESKKWSWLLLLLQCWPQWRAVRVMNLNFKNDRKFEEKKKELMMEVTSTEPYLEAWPSIIIMTVIMVYAMDGRNNPDPSQEFCEMHPENRQCAVFGGFGGSPWFFTTYSISVITGSLGITKFLQVGPFSVLSNEGTLSGICRWRFILAYLAVMLSIVTKGLLIGIFISVTTSSYVVQEILGIPNGTQSVIAMTALLFGFFMIPNLIFAFGSIASSTGINKKFIKIIANYPAAWMLPIATYFVIGSRKMPCCSKDKRQKNELVFSKKFSAINMTLTVLIYAAFISFFYTPRSTGQYANRPLNPYSDELLYAYFIPVLMLSLTFNIIFLLLDEKCCCSRSRKCFCSSCCGSNCFQHDIYCIDTKNDNLAIVKIEN